MRAYKGFNRNEDGTLSCRGFVYKLGKTYKHKGKIKLCESGFHACHELWQTWPYYPNNGNNEFWEVECGGDIIESVENTGKFVCSEITLIKELDMSDVAKFDYAYAFSEGFAPIELDEKWNFINTEGELLSEQWFDYAGCFLEGFAAVKLDGKWNHIDTEGKLLSPEQWYDNVWKFSEGFAKVRLNGEVYRIDKEGKIVG